jgi:hypothetical protein
MNVEVFALCDAATVSAGKLNILGAFDSVNSRQVPGVHAHCAVAMRIRFSRMEEGDHKVKIDFVDEDGKPAMPSLDGVLKVLFRDDDKDSAVTNFVINIQQLKLSNFGAYSFELSIDGGHRASLPLFLKEIKQSQQ